MKLSDFEVLSFDCYGTLIDWESGILTALQGWLEREGAEVGEARLLELFAHHESHQQAATPAMRYPQLLATVQQRIAEELAVPVTEDDTRAFGESVGKWPPFPDSAAALAYLKKHYRLVILSNVDRASFAASNRQLDVTFDAIFTAEDIGCYKPHPRNFQHLIEGIEAMGFRRSDILHTAQSLFHDHVPAQRAGLATCWVERAPRAGAGAARAPSEPVTPHFHVKSMAELVARHRAGD